MLAISVTSSLLIVFSTSTKMLPLVNPALAEEKKEVDFAKKDKSDSDLDANNCKSEKVLKGASNKKDLKILSECEKATGKVKHVQEMPDGDYKFFLKVDIKNTNLF